MFSLFLAALLEIPAKKKKRPWALCLLSKGNDLSGTGNWESTWCCEGPTWQIRGGQHCPCRSRSTGSGRHKRRCTPHCRWSRYYKMDQYCMNIRESAPSAALEILHLTRIHHIRETDEVQMKTHRTLQWTISLCSHIMQQRYTGMEQWKEAGVSPNTECALCQRWTAGQVLRQST